MGESDGAPPTFTSKQITDFLVQGFAASLLITTAGFILYGINCYQFFVYAQGLAKKDPFLTKIWVSLVFVVASASVFYQVYFDWIYSISFFTTGITNTPSVVNGTVVVLYSVVVMLVQFFWLVCLDAMMVSKFKFWIILPIGACSVCSFTLAIVVAALSVAKPGPFGSWPTPTISIFLRTVLGLDLGVDLAILTAILTQLRKMRAEFGHLKKTFSKLSYIFLVVTLISTLIIVGELIINAPQPGSGKSFLNFTITFAALISPLYMSAMLSILNARGEMWPGKRGSAEGDESEEESGENRRPQMNFTNEVYSRAADRDSRQLPLRNHAATEPAIDIEREAGSRRSSLEDCDEHRRYSNDGSADQIQSTQIGIQTI